jgi:hypothetical protein
VTDSADEGTYSTLGREFRTPAHPAVLSALGRALYCFLSLEESVTAVLSEAEAEAGAATLAVTRGKTAGAKEHDLVDLANKYRTSPAGEATADSLDKAAAAFKTARKTVRNELLHAQPYTAGDDESGRYLPGLSYTAPDGQSWKTISRTPEDLLDLASEIERALDPLSAARDAVRALPLSALTVRYEPPPIS